MSKNFNADCQRKQHENDLVKNKAAKQDSQKKPGGKKNNNLCSNSAVSLSNMKPNIILQPLLWKEFYENLVNVRQTEQLIQKG